MSKSLTTAMAIPDEYWTDVIECTQDAKVEADVFPHFTFHDQDGRIILSPTSGRLVPFGTTEDSQHREDRWALLRFGCYALIVTNRLDKKTGLETIKIQKIGRNYENPLTLQGIMGVNELTKTTPVADRRHHLQDRVETPGTPSKYAKLYEELSELQLPEKTGPSVLVGFSGP